MLLKASVRFETKKSWQKNEGRHTFACGMASFQVLLLLVFKGEQKLSGFWFAWNRNSKKKRSFGKLEENIGIGLTHGEKTVDQLVKALRSGDFQEDGGTTVYHLEPWFLDVCVLICLDACQYQNINDFLDHWNLTAVSRISHKNLRNSTLSLGFHQLQAQVQRQNLGEGWCAVSVFFPN